MRQATAVKKEVVVMRSFNVGEKFSSRLSFESKEELDRVKAALKPLGYTFRFPKGR